MEVMKMLKWYFEKKKWLGFCDGDFLYRVFETPEGWMWEDSQSYEGECDFETERQAMNAAAEHFSKRLAMEDKLLLIDLEFSLEELEEIHWDDVAHERMEIMRGLA
jgi:hypothetical protein